MKSVKKTLKIIGNVILWLFVAFAVFMTVLFFSSQGNKEGLPNLMGKSLITIQSDSMKPTFRTGDLIIDKVLTTAEKTELQPGDIITYYVDLNGDGITELNTHRIVDSYEEDGYTYYITKGDNTETNPVNDAEPVMSSYVLAKYTGVKLGGVGSVISFLQTPTGFLCVIVLPLVVFFLFELYSFIALVIRLKGKNKISAEEEEEIKKRAVEEYLRRQQETEKTDNTEDSGK
ncbi:MAG: signal peptidase I [Clostridia bacterium]|nr:signal peptidase I [Clostridia bacterium]